VGETKGGGKEEQQREWRERRVRYARAIGEGCGGEGGERRMSEDWVGER